MSSTLPRLWAALALAASFGVLLLAVPAAHAGYSTEKKIYPSSFAVTMGSLTGGSLSSLFYNDLNFLTVKSTTSKKTIRQAQFTTTFNNVPSSPTTLTLWERSKSGLGYACGYYLHIWNWRTSSWVQLEYTYLGGTAGATTSLGWHPLPLPYSDWVSGGQLRTKSTCWNGSFTIALNTDMHHLGYNP